MQIKVKSQKSKVKKILFYVLCSMLYVIFFSGCANISTTILPSYIKKINVNTFVNKSFRPDLGEKVTSAVIREFIMDGRLTPAGENESDAILYGEIKQYALEPLSYNEKMDVEEYKVLITVDIWLKDLKQDKIIWRENNIETWAIASSTRGGLEIKVENEAINEVVEKLARKVVKRVIDGWSNI